MGFLIIGLLFGWVFTGIYILIYDILETEDLCLDALLVLSILCGIFFGPFSYILVRLLHNDNNYKKQIVLIKKRAKKNTTEQE